MEEWGSDYGTDDSWGVDEEKETQKEDCEWG
jgi:hypothetical protein